MTELQDAIQALKNADAAGDFEAARKLAKAVESLAGPEALATPGERRVGQVEQFLTENVVNPVAGAYRSTVDAIKGPEGLPDLGEFGPAAGGIGGPSFKSALGLMATMEPKAQLDIIREQFPGTKVYPVSAENKDYFALEWQNPETGGVEKGYLNAPGLSFRDVTNFLGQTVVFGKMAAGRGGSLLGRMAKTGAGTTGASVGLDLGAEQLGSKQGVDYGTAGVTGLAGTVFEGLSPVAARAWRLIFRGRNLFRPSTGKLTEKGQQEARKQGLDPDDMEARVAREFARLTEAGDPAAAARSARAGEFGIPATRGQTSQNYPQLNLEERMRKGLEGETPAAVVKGFDERQALAIEGAQGRVTTRLTGRDPLDTDADLGAVVQLGLQRRESAAGKAVDAAYDEVRDMGSGFFVRAAVEILPQNMKQAIDDSILDRTLTPAAWKVAKKYVPKMLSEEGVSIKTVETLRRQINAAYGTAANPTDRRNVLKFKKALDDWVDETVDRGLFYGDETVVVALKAARGLRTQYGKQFQDKATAGGKIVENIWAKAETPEQVVNYLFGQGTIGNRIQATAGIRKIGKIVGRDSAEWQALREMAWRRISLDKSGLPVTPRMLDKNLREAIGRNGSLMRELYNDAERAFMKRYNQAIQATKAESTNPSQTAFAIETAFRYTLRRFGQRESFVKGNIAGGTLLNFLARMPLNPFDLSGRAREIVAGRALKPLPSPWGRAPWFVGAGAAGAGALNEEQ